MAGGFAGDSDRATSAGLGGGAADPEERPQGHPVRGRHQEDDGRPLVVLVVLGRLGLRTRRSFFRFVSFFPDSFFAVVFAAFGEGTVTGRAGISCRCSAPHAGQRGDEPASLHAQVDQLDQALTGRTEDFHREAPSDAPRRGRRTV